VRSVTTSLAVNTRTRHFTRPSAR